MSRYERERRRTWRLIALGFLAVWWLVRWAGTEMANRDYASGAWTLRY